VTVRIVLADDHKMLRDGLRRLIEQEPGLAVVGEAADGRALVDLVQAARPDLVVLDVSMPGLNGIEATRRIRALPGPPRVIMLSMHADRRFVVESIKAGAAGYLLKDDGFDELVRAIGLVMDGHLVLAPRLAEAMLQDYVAGSGGELASAYGRLSPREREVLQLLAEGHATKQIAAQLGVSVKTVETLRQHVMDKLDLHSVADLTKYAVREGLTGLGG
jgi:DNA-binding NarL/FixJ family response regulator